MSKYKKGDKFEIEITEVLESKSGTIYRSNFSTLVFDDYGLDNLNQIKPKYEKGDEVIVHCKYDNKDHVGLIVDYREAISIVLLKEDGKYLVDNGCIFVNNENIISKTGKKINLELK